MKPILIIIFCLSIFSGLTAQDTTTVTPKFYHHEILLTPTGTFMGTFFISGLSYAAGYRYHYSPRAAFRITQSMSSKGGTTSSTHTAYTYNSFQFIKLGYQYALSKKPFHALVYTDLLFLNTQLSTGSTSYPYNGIGGRSVTEYEGKSSGFGIGGGIGAEWLIKKRVALLLAIDLYSTYETSKGNTTFTATNYSTYSESQTNGFGAFGDITLSVSYRFR